MLRRQETPKLNNPIKKLQKKVMLQAAIAIWTIIITFALIFGMSAAWYTNILQTSGLQFQAEAWGFSGQVMVSEESIEAGPGDSGIIGITVSNDGEDMVDVSVHVSKAQMVEPMKQRLYFYVEVEQERNGEQMTRVYINTQDYYTYSILSYSDLALTENRFNDALLKWQWVYDMEGYYFLGTVAQSDDDSRNVVANVEDYLRPVEYDLDSAEFNDGLLTEANGMTTGEFLSQLGATDGYVGGITPSKWPGYYQVSVDENGYGVWVYLCTWAEIQQATTYDTELGKAAAEALEQGISRENYVARLTLVGNVSSGEFQEVATPDELATALNTGGLITLTRDMELSETIVVNTGSKSVLDLNGCTITGTTTSAVIDLSAGSNLIVLDGEILPAAGATHVIDVSGSELTLSKVNILQNGKYGVYISDYNSTVDSRVRIFDSTITTSNCSVYAWGNGSSRDGYTQVIIENTTMTSDYIAIAGNGTARYWGTEMQIYQSNITGKYAAIYQPQSDSVSRVIESTLSGITGVAIKGGELAVINSTIMGTGTLEQIQEPSYNNSGFSDTGDGIYVDCGYGQNIDVTITGESTVVTSANAKAIRVYEENSPYANVIVTGGAFSSDVSAFLKDRFSYSPITGKVTYIGGINE